MSGLRMFVLAVALLNSVSASAAVEQVERRRLAQFMEEVEQQSRQVQELSQTVAPNYRLQRSIEFLAARIQRQARSLAKTLEKPAEGAARQGMQRDSQRLRDDSGRLVDLIRALQLEAGRAHDRVTADSARQMQRIAGRLDRAAGKLLKAQI